MTPKAPPRQNWDTPLYGLDGWIAECLRRGYSKENIRNFLGAALHLSNAYFDRMEIAIKDEEK